MKVVVTGGTGYVGPAVVQALLREGHDVTVLEHRRPLDLPDAPRLLRLRGDVTDAESLRRAFPGHDAVVHLVAIIREEPRKGVTFERLHVEATKNVVDAAREAGIRRFLLMSANGVDAGDTPYFATKLAMERMVKDVVAFDWTIFRPSYVAGGRKGGFDQQFATIVDRMPILPSFAGGRFEIQPVSRENVGDAFALALGAPRTFGKTYVLVGPERMTWNAYLKRLTALRRRRRLLVHAPRFAVLLMARALGRLFPADPDQLRMLMRGNTGDASEAVEDLGLKLEPWENAVRDLRR